MSIAKHWVFTLNNYDEADLSKLSPASIELSENPPDYLIWQEEKGESGTPHLQGFVSLNKKQRISAVKKVVGDRARIAVANGTPDQSRKYCSKIDTRKEGTEPRVYGNLPSSEQGKRNDITAYRDACREGEMTLKRAFEDHEGIACRYPRFIKACMNVYAVVPSVEEHPLYDWQKALTERLEKPPGDREIIFVVDNEGNHGKTYFAKRYCALHPDSTQYMETGKKHDMSYALEIGIRVLFVNVTRMQVENIQYSFLEAVKDGMVFSPKYESHLKKLEKVHVVVLMNQDPDMTLLSNDRYDIIYAE